MYKLDPESDPHQFADVKLKCMEYEPVLALFQGFDLFLNLDLDLDPDSHHGEKSDPKKIGIQIRIRFISRIRTRINVMRIHNSVWNYAKVLRSMAKVHCNFEKFCDQNAYFRHYKSFFERLSSLTLPVKFPCSVSLLLAFLISIRIRRLNQCGSGSTTRHLIVFY
jgi:hypothetical protein